MGRIKGRLKMVAAVCVAAVMLINAHNDRRKLYTPVNLLAGTPIESSAVLPTEAAPSSAPAAPTDVPAQPDVSIEANTLVGAGSSLPFENLPGISHTVLEGENLYRIALQYNLSAEAIAAANGLPNEATIYAGQSLWIPDVDRPETAVIQAATPAPTATEAEIIPTIPVTYPPPPTSVNGIPIDTIAVMPQPVIQHIRNIYSIGQSLGRNPRAFSKLGDSTIENPHFLTRFDSTPYHLGDFAYLQDVINYYAGSFGRQGNAVHRGLHTWSVLDPMWAGGACEPGENMLECELRVQNSSVLIIHLGSNDAGVPEATERNFREIVEFCMINGVIPILGTKADRHEGSNINNEIIRRIAFDYNLPLWDFDPVAGTLPGRGLAPDGVHMTSFFAHDWRSAEAYQRGYGLMNLTALIALDKVWRAVNSSG